MRIVFLNGWAASSRMLESFKVSLPSHYELCVLDNLHQYELTEIVTKIDTLMTSETVLMGWSLGGMLALYYSKVGNKTPKALVLLNTPICFLAREGFPEGVKKADFEGLKHVVTAHDAQSVVRRFSHLLVAGSTCYKEERRLLKGVFNTETLPDWSALERGLMYLEMFDFRAILKDFSHPTLCILGEHDAFIHTASYITELAEIRHAKTAIIKNMGHYPFGMFVEQVKENVIDYVVDYVVALGEASDASDDLNKVRV